MVKPGRRAGGSALGPAHAVPFPCVAESGAVDAGDSAEEDDAPVRGVVSHRVVVPRCRTGGSALGPPRAIPFPCVAKVDGVKGANGAAEQDRAPVRRVVGHRVKLPRYRAGVGCPLGPARTVPCPSVAKVDGGVGANGAAEQDNEPARRVVGHRMANSRFRTGGCPLGPACAVPFPGVADVGAAAVVAAEEDDTPARGVIGHRMSAPRCRTGGSALGPGCAVPFPGVAEGAAVVAAEEHDLPARGIAGH